ncbi:MAG: GxxExxY protein [Anaerolineae bacterium]
MIFHGRRSELVDKIIEIFSQIYAGLGPGLRKDTYAKQALSLEFKSQKIAYKMNKPVQFRVDEVVLGNFMIDFLVEESVVVHVYATDELLEEHDREIYTYLRSANVHEGVMLNFGPEPSYIYKTADHYTRGKQVWTTPN